MRDPLKQTEAIRNEVFKSLEEKHSNIQTKNRTLKLSNFRSDDLPDPDDYARQREILNLGKTEGVNIYGKVELIDNKTGKVIDSKDKMKLGFIPTTTNRHSFIVNGKEYIVHNQMRLKSGVFTRIDRLGNPVADFNLAKGSNMSMQYKPEAQYTEIQTGNAKIPLYTILKDVYEIPDKKLSNVFGSDVHKQESQAINSKNRDKYLHKLHDAVTFKKSTDFTPKEIKENLKTYFDNTVMDPQNNKNTIGIPSSKIDPKILAKTAKDVLEIYKGKKDPTWKDNIAFKEVNAVEDFIRERLTKTKRINEMHMKVKPKIDRAETVYDTGVGKLINANINKFFKDSDLVNYPLQVNPMEFLENAHKITSLGEGGVTSTNSLPVDARNLHLSQLGFIDPVRTPDNINAGVDLRMGLFASKQDKSLVIPVVDKKGKIVKIKHDDLFNHIYIVKTEPPQSNGKYRAMYKGKMVEVSKDKIEYFLHPDSLFTVSTATIPFKKNTQGQRNAMGAKMTTQALSLIHRELPIVDTKAAQIAAKYYTPKSPVDGVVKKVTKDFIIILGNDKIEHKVNIPNKFALNYHSYLHVDPSIKEGMKVKKGEILGDNNFTREGKLALGINAKVAFMPYRGLNFEDGFVVTRQGADKFTSSHIFQETVDLTDPTIDMDIKKHRSYFPQKYTVDQLSKLENGIVKKGTKVYAGDPLIISLKKRNQSPEILRQGLMASRITNPYKDVSIDWTKDYPGTVTEIIQTPKMIKVVIEATAPLVEGDKICVDALTEVFTKKGWKYINQVDIHDKVLMLKDGVDVEWDEPQAIHIYQGPHNMLRRVNRDLDMFVTLDHYELALTGGQVSRVQAKDLIGKEWSSISYKKGAINIQKHDNNNTEEVIVKYDQPVYCLTTKHSNFYIRRRGKERFTGNCSRYGSKGIVVKIIDNHEAPKYKNGEIPDVLINPAAVPSRMNVGQIFEAQMAKALQKAGKRVEYDDMNNRDTFKEVKAIMKKYKTKDTDTLYDPVSKKNIKDVFNGTQYFLKLAKQTETNFAARAGGDYDIDQRPVKGGEEGAKSVGTLDMYAFLSHNSRAILKEKATQTSQYNPEFWAAVLSGQPLPPSQTTFTFNKTLEMLRGAGINVQKKGNILHSLPFTDKDIKKISSGEIKSGKMVSNKPDPVTGLQFRPEKGGLFDPVKTGGLIGSDYSHIKLHEPVIHKWFEAPIKTLLGLNTKELAAIQYRDKTVTVNGKQKTGVEAIRQLLKEIDVEKELKALRIKIKREDLKLDQKDQIIKKIQYLKALKEYKMTPDKAYVNELIPIIPPKYRPIYPKETGEVVTSDANHLYREIAEVNASLNSPLMKALGQDSQEYKNKLRELHVSIGKMQGVEKSENPDLREPSGFIEIIKGKGQPKYGYFQHKVMSKVQDIVGRGTIAPDPKLGLDECSIPEDMAWKIYSPFITGEMVKRGYEYDKAVEEIEKRTQTARNALIAEMNRRPVILNRAPSLHKFSMMAFRPKLNNTKTIYICPLVVKPFGADFDGDSCIGGVFGRFINSTDKLDNQKNSYYNEDMFYYSSNERSSNMLSQKQNIRYTHGLINLEKFPRIEETKVVTGNKEEYQVPEGVEVLTVWNGERKWIKPDSFSIHNNVSIIQVKTNTGRTVKVTNDHSLVSLDKNLSYVDAQAKIGLCMPRIIEPVTTGNLDHIEIGLDQTGLTNKMKEKVPANFNLGFYIGAVIADGWVDSENKVNISKTCPELARYVKEECLPNIFGHEIGVQIQHNPHKFSKEVDIDCLSTKIISSSKALSLYMTQWVGKGAVNKHLPEFWAEGKEDFRWGLLSGLINGDGTVTEVKAKSKPKPQTQIHYDTLSRFLAHEVVALGSSLGLICTMTQYSSSSTGNTMYAVHFSQESIGKMRNKLFLTVKNKKEVLSRFEMSDTATRNKFTPTLPLNRVQELRTYFKYKDVNSGIWKSTKTEEETINQRAINAIYIELGKTKNDRAFNKEWSKKVVGYDLPIFKNDPFWIKWKELVLDDSIEWEIIESIEPVPSESVAYDLTIPPAYTMVNDWGLILFDTMTCHVVASEEAIQEAYGMMPSKNLFSPRNNSVNYKPDQEAIMGLYLGSKGNDNKEKKTIKTFKTVKEAKQAYDEGLIDADDKIKVAELI